MKLTTVNMSIYLILINAQVNQSFDMIKFLIQSLT